MTGASLRSLADAVLAGRGTAHKIDIADAVAALGVDAASAIRVGDDCAAIPDGDGWLLFAIEGLRHRLRRGRPAVRRLVRRDGQPQRHRRDGRASARRGRRHLGDGPRPGRAGAGRLARGLAGLRRAGRGWPHQPSHRDGRAGGGGARPRQAPHHQLRCPSPATCSSPPVDTRGGFRGGSLNWDAASGAPAERLRGDLALLPDLAEDGLVAAGKDISMAGLVGTVMMLCEGSGCGARLEVDAVPLPRRGRSRPFPARLSQLRVHPLDRAGQGRGRAVALRRARHRLRGDRRPSTIPGAFGYGATTRRSRSGTCRIRSSAAVLLSPSPEDADARDPVQGSLARRRRRDLLLALDDHPRLLRSRPQLHATEFLAVSRAGLGAASERVRARYGGSGCSRAMAQLAAIETRAKTLDAGAAIEVEAFLG